MAIDVARVQAHRKPCGIADLSAWNWAAKLRQRSNGAFRGLDVRRKRDRHIATVIAVAVTGVTEVGRKPQRLMDAPTPLLSSRRYALERIEPAPNPTSRQNAKPRYWSAATVRTWGSLPRAMLSRGRRGVDIEVRTRRHDEPDGKQRRWRSGAGSAAASGAAECGGTAKHADAKISPSAKVGPAAWARGNDAMKPLQRVAFIGNHLPRHCGIATFTHDLHRAVSTARPDLETCVVAMNDPGGGYDYPAAVRFQIAEETTDGYVGAADFLNTERFDVVCLQHEYGIFGGEAGGHIIELLKRLTMPIVTTLHTVLPAPTLAQYNVISKIIARSTKIVVMAEKGREFLRSVHDVSPQKIEVIPHGIPDFPFLRRITRRLNSGSVKRPSF